MTELIRTRCKQGFLIITDTDIKIELSGVFGEQWRNRSLLRSAFTGLEKRRAGLLGGWTLIFHGAGDQVLQADFVAGKSAEQIAQLLA